MRVAGLGLLHGMVDEAATFQPAQIGIGEPSRAQLGDLDSELPQIALHFGGIFDALQQNHEGGVEPVGAFRRQTRDRGWKATLAHGLSIQRE